VYCIAANHGRFCVNTVSVHVHVDENPERLDRLTRLLREELLGLDIDDVTLARNGHAPPGARGDAISVGTLIVTLANSAGLVGVCQLLRTWVTRDQGRRITIKDGKRTLEITGANTAQHQQIIDAFLSGTDSQ
jgi:hypothetical protein